MALSDALKNSNVASTSAPVAPTAPAPAPAPAVEGGDKIKGEGTTTARHKALVAEGGKIRQGYTPEEAQAEGSKSDKIAFICALGNPAKPQTRKQNNEDKPSFRVVGYKFKALENCKVPKAPLKSGFTNMLDVEPVTMVPVKKGETFALNIYETGYFISLNQYGGFFTGDGTSVYLGVKFSNSRIEPLPVLNKTGKGSVKENMEPVADMIGATATTPGTPQVKAEYQDKFAVLFEKRSAGRKDSGDAVQSGETIKNIAAAFSAYLTSRN